MSSNPPKADLVRAALAMVLLSAGMGLAEPVTLPFDSEYPPLSFRGPEGVPDGFDVAVARALSEKMGLEADFVPADFVRIQRGNWPEAWPFAVASMSITEQRRARFDFIGPYYYDYVVLIGPETGSGPLPRPGAGDRIGVCSGCVYRAFLEGDFMSSDGEQGQPRYPDAGIVEFATDTDMLRALVDADPAIEFGVTSARFAEYFRDLGFAIAVSSETIFVTPTFIAAARPARVSLPDLTAAFEDLRDAGSIADLSVEHLGRDYTDPEVFAEPLPGQ